MMVCAMEAITAESNARVVPRAVSSGLKPVGRNSGSARMAMPERQRMTARIESASAGTEAKKMQQREVRTGETANSATACARGMSRRAVRKNQRRSEPSMPRKKTRRMWRGVRSEKAFCRSMMKRMWNVDSVSETTERMTRMASTGMSSMVVAR